MVGKWLVNIYTYSENSKETGEKLTCSNVRIFFSSVSFGCVLFYSCFSLLKSLSFLQFVGVEGFVTAIVDLYPQYLRKGHRKEIFIGVMSIFWFLIGLSMVTNVSVDVNIFGIYACTCM